MGAVVVGAVVAGAVVAAGVRLIGTGSGSKNGAQSRWNGVALVEGTMSSRARVRIGVTMGDPSGIGPEIALKAVSNPQVTEVCEPVLYGPQTASERARFSPGMLSPEAGLAALQAIEQVVVDAMAGQLEAITTGPISKEALDLAGVSWRGHTELLAHLTDTKDVAMMFHSPRLRVVLATVHIPLSAVPGLLTRERIETVLKLAAAELPRFGVAEPRLAVAGLNPHAGEGGLLGFEDSEIIAPAVKSARQSGIDVTGPVPSDTVFRQAMDGQFDAVIACYHDQGLIPVKLLAFGDSVNVTLGLPIVRTSVDHGTAFDIAGLGVADATSLVNAILLAARLARSKATGLRMITLAAST